MSNDFISSLPFPPFSPTCYRYWPFSLTSSSFGNPFFPPHQREEEGPFLWRGGGGGDDDREGVGVGVGLASGKKRTIRLNPSVAENEENSWYMVGRKVFFFCTTILLLKPALFLHLLLLSPSLLPSRLSDDVKHSKETFLPTRTKRKEGGGRSLSATSSLRST